MVGGSLCNGEFQSGLSIYIYIYMYIYIFITCLPYIPIVVAMW